MARIQLSGLSALDPQAIADTLRQERDRYLAAALDEKVRENARADILELKTKLARQVEAANFFNREYFRIYESDVIFERALVYRVSVSRYDGRFSENIGAVPPYILFKLKTFSPWKPTENFVVSSGSVTEGNEKLLRGASFKIEDPLMNREAGLGLDDMLYLSGPSGGWRIFHNIVINTPPWDLGWGSSSSFYRNLYRNNNVSPVNYNSVQAMARSLGYYISGGSQHEYASDRKATDSAKVKAYCPFFQLYSPKTTLGLASLQPQRELVAKAKAAFSFPIIIEQREYIHQDNVVFNKELYDTYRPFPDNLTADLLDIIDRPRLPDHPPAEVRSDPETGEILDDG